MTDRLTRVQRHINMSRVRGQNTMPELGVRKNLHALGFRFRLHANNLPGKPDIVLARWRTAIFVHGCFWHRHECGLFRWPATRAKFWKEKLLRNVARDRKARSELINAGWRVLVVWECALKGPGRLSRGCLREQLSDFIRGDSTFAEIEANDEPGHMAASSATTFATRGGQLSH